MFLAMEFIIMSPASKQVQYAAIDKHIHKLAANGILDLLQKLVDEGANVNSKDEQGTAPLVNVRFILPHQSFVLVIT